MKVWFWVLGVVAAMWSGIWFAGAYGTERVMGAWLDARADEGWLVNYDSLETAGYPTRFRTTLTGLELADPETGWAWLAPQVRLTQPSYRPQHIHAEFPPEQSLASPFERLTITSAVMEAALVMRAGTDLALDRSEMALRDVEVASTADWAMALDSASFTMARQDDAEARYDILFEAAALTPPDPVAAVLNPAGILPAAMEAMRFDAVMGFDRAWDITALEDARPGITQIELADLSARWGDLSLRMAGQMEVDTDGYPTGEISVRAQNWREMVEMAVNAGVVPAEAQGTLEGVLGLVANLSGRPEDIDAPLSFRNGLVFFGPVPLGAAPQLVLR